MSRYSVINIANRFLVFHGGWSLAINRYPMVEGQVKAWDSGPVFKKLWDSIRDHGYDDKGLLSEKDEQPLHPDDERLIRRVWAKYERYDPIELTRFIQQPGTPWSNTYFREEGPRIISEEEMRIYFERLAIAGRYSERVFGPSL